MGNLQQTELAPPFKLVSRAVTDSIRKEDIFGIRVFELLKEFRKSLKSLKMLKIFPLAVLDTKMNDRISLSK